MSLLRLSPRHFQFYFVDSRVYDRQSLSHLNGLSILFCRFSGLVLDGVVVVYSNVFQFYFVDSTSAVEASAVADGFFQFYFVDS